MGAKNSIELQIDTKAPQAGQTLNGSVVVKIRNRFRAPKASLYVTGKESVFAKRTSGFSQSDERQFFYLDLALSRYSQTRNLTRGTYKYPFSIKIPASLPSSTIHTIGSRKRGFQIEYKASASLGKLSCEKSFSLASEPLPDEQVACMVRPSNFPVSALGLINKGTVTLGASLEDAHIGRGESLELNLACQNTSTAEIRRVEIKVIEECRWNNPSSPKGSNSTKTTLIHLQDVDLPGLSKARSDRANVRLSLTDPLRQSMTLESIYFTLASGTSKVYIPIPTAARDTYSGQLININHFIEVRLQTPLMVNNPSTCIPVRIGNAPIKRTKRKSKQHSRNGNSTQSSVSNHQSSQGPLFDDEPEHAVPAVSSNVVEEIPIVSAVVLEETRLPEPPPGTMDVGIIVLGADAILPPPSLDLSDVTPMAPPSPNDSFEPGNYQQYRPMNLTTLHFEIRASTNALDLLGRKVSDGKWCQWFATLSPDDFGSVIQNVPNEFDQPRIALFLSPYVNGIHGMNCMYAAAAVRSSSEWVRTTTAKFLLPACLDIAFNYELIRAELNEWEQTVTNSDFEQAILDASTRP